MESKELREGGRRLNESFQNYLEYFGDFMKILERAIQKEVKRIINDDVSQFEYNREGDSEPGDCSMKESEEVIIKSTLVDQFQEI